MSGTGILTSDYGIAPDPVSANAQALGAPPINLSQRAVAPPKPKEPESNLALARQRREQGENPSRDPNAKNPYSSAGGADQIIDGTWLKLMNTYHPEMVQGQTKEQILAMRTDKDLSGAMAGKYDEENAKILASNGIAPTPNFINALYRAGPGDGLKLIQAAHQNPNALVKDIAPALATPGNNGAGNLTVGQFLVDPYQHGPGAQSSDTPQQAFTIAKGNEILAQMLNDQTEGKKELARVSKDYKPIDIPPMPKPPEVDPLSTFSSLAGVFATLAAGFSRTPAIAAMNGLAGAMHAAKESKWEDYKAHYEQFKTSSELAFKAHEQHSADVRQALEMMTKNMAAGSTMLNAVIALSDDQQMHQLHQAQEYREMARLQDQRDDKARELQEKMPVTLATTDLTAAMENLKAAQKGGDQTEVARATELVQQAENRLTDVKRAGMGGFRTGSMSAQNIAMQRFIADNPGATAQEIQQFALGFKEDAPGVAARKDRAMQLKEDHEKNWQQINEDKTSTQREIADKRLAAAADWHAKQAEMSIRKLDDSASLSDRKQNELERHNKLEEQIKSDWHLTQAEKDVLNRNEAIRWHDLQNERGWGTIESREHIAEEQITSREKLATDKWKAQQIASDGSQKAERKARFDELKSTMPPDTPTSKVWDAVDQQIMEAKAPRISEFGLRSAAERFIAGDKTALQGFGRNPILFGKIESEIARLSQERGLSGTDLTRIQQDYQASTKAIKDFATGKQGQTAQSLNVATQHLSLLSDAAQALAKNDSRTVNSLTNAFKNEFGWDEPITFNAIKTIVGSEVEKAVAGSAGALEDRRELRDGLSAQSTPGQLTSVIEGYKGLMAGQLQGLEKTYERTTRRQDFRDEFLLPEARKEMDRIAPRGGQSQSAGPKDGDTGKSKSGRDIVYRNGSWEYK